MITVPIAITALPEPPSTSSPSDFDSKADAFLGAFPTLRTEINTISNTTYNNAIDASNSATIASNSVNVIADSLNAPVWVSGTTYAQYFTVLSPTSLLIYRKITASSVSTVDPANDIINWKNVSNFVTSVAALTLGTAGADVSSTVATSTSTPVITLNLPTASATNRGLLAPADWTTFNNKQPAGSYVTSTGIETLTNKTLTSYTETVFAVVDGTTVNLDPNNGPIQTWTLGANRTPGQANWASGQSIILLVDDGTLRTVTWTTLNVSWKTDAGFSPQLNTTGYTAITLWKVGSTIYGARVGDA